MPINRADGRHWCAPDREEPGDDGTWTCPECGTVYIADDTVLGGRVWETPEAREQRLSAAQSIEEESSGR